MNYIPKKLILLFSILNMILIEAQETADALQSLPFGSVKPSGWLKVQMQKDLAGFVGHLDEMVPELINDPIYGTGRLQKNTQSKDLGNIKSGDAAGDEQYKWWNSETQSNWWDGYLRNVLLLDDLNGIEKVNQYIKNRLATQDEDGYLGIYDRELRYKFDSENGELWSKATLYRGLLAYYEYTNDTIVWMAVKNGVENVMQNYPIYASSPFNSGNQFNGGVSHGLTFTDVLSKMYEHTHDLKYVAYALFLYEDFSKTYQSESDVQLHNILDADYKLKAHGVHAFEHLRPLIVAKYATNDIKLNQALEIYLERIQKATTITGGAMGDEWIAERTADATHTGYEYCSLHELLDSYALLYQKSGNPLYGDAIENTFYNAAQGARNPNHSCIAYLKTDNSYEMLGTKNGEVEPDRKQTRYKYSPAHQDVAVCCSPNAGRITPYFVQNSWMKENENTLVATLIMPNVLETNLGNTKVRIENQTEYPYQNHFNLIITLAKPTSFTLKIRKPSWVQSIKTNEKYSIENDFIIIHRTFHSNDQVVWSFQTEIEIKADSNRDMYFTYGALIFAKPIEALELAGRVYADGFSDYTYEPISRQQYAFAKNQKTTYKNGMIHTKLINQQTHKPDKVTLIPIGKTILRQTTFNEYTY